MFFDKRMEEFDLLEILVVRAIAWWYAVEPMAPALAVTVVLLGLVAGGLTLDRLTCNCIIQPLERDIAALILGSVVGTAIILIFR